MINKNNEHKELKQTKPKKIVHIIIYTVIFIILVYNVVIIVQKVNKPNEIPSFLGYKNFIIVSGSMEPTLNIGDIIFIKEDEEIEDEDIISFREDGVIVTHRVIQEIKEDNEIKYKTKGDANNVEDAELVSKKQIEGKYKFKIPKIGKFIIFLQTII